MPKVTYGTAEALTICNATNGIGWLPLEETKIEDKIQELQSRLKGKTSSSPVQAKRTTGVKECA
jgi:hypothetical protein